MFQMNVPKQMALTATYLINRLPCKPLHFISPIELFIEKSSTLTHLKVFGALVMFTFRLINRTNLITELPHLLGLFEHNKGYICYNPTSRKLIVTTDVSFDEGITYYPHSNIIAMQGESIPCHFQLILPLMKTPLKQTLSHSTTTNLPSS